MRQRHVLITHFQKVTVGSFCNLDKKTMSSICLRKCCFKTVKNNSDLVSKMRILLELQGEIVSVRSVQDCSKILWSRWVGVRAAGGSSTL